jgi:hypothetical protein
VVPPGFQQNASHWYNPACFTLPPPYTFGNLGRDNLRGPDFVNFDFTLYKNFRLTESKSFQFRTEAFNIFNRTNLFPPGATAGGSLATAGGLGGSVSTAISSPSFMKILDAAAAREIQFALKFIF